MRFQAYDLAIYYNPYNALAYLAGDHLSLTDWIWIFATAESAIRDFSRSIRLDSTISKAGISGKCARLSESSGTVCGDALRAFQLDTGLRDGCLNLTLRICPDSNYLITGTSPVTPRRRSIARYCAGASPGS